jgi:hypothetical protein
MNHTNIKKLKLIVLDFCKLDMHDIGDKNHNKTGFTFSMSLDL